MATKIITISLSLLIIVTDVQPQFFDLFQGFQPFVPLHQTTKRPDFPIYPQENSQKKSKGDTAHITNDRHTSKEQARKQLSHSYDRDSNKHTTKRKHATTASLLNFNYFTTPAPSKKVIKNSSRRSFDSSISENLGQENLNKRAYNLNFEDKRQSYDDTINNIGGNYYTTRVPTSKRPYATERPNYTTAKPNYVTTKPNRATTKASYTTSRASYTTTRNYHVTNGPVNDVNSYYTTHRPGVRPANVDLSKPPITNKPPALAVYPRPTDSSVIRFPEDPDTSPELISGPDEDKMSYAEKRRYIELAEKMCDKYKSLNVKKLEAIPLVPSPEPVRVNVSVCPPTNVPLVVGGKVVTIQEFPHMALLGWTKLQGGGYSWKCGASLISDQYVLTASHCAYQDKDDTVVTGAPRVVQLGSSYLDDTGALVVKVLSVVRHPKYTQTRSYYDIALVKLVKPVTFSEVVKPACLGEPPGVGEPIIATGWGRTEFGGSQSLELRSVSIPVWDMNECQQALGTSRKLPNGPSRDSQICAGEKQGGKDTCQGDSGGPAQIQDGCAWRVVAVTSVGRSCGAPNTPALYATIHRAFIAAQVFGKPEPTRNQNNNNNNYSNQNSNSHNQKFGNQNNNRQENSNNNEDYNNQDFNRPNHREGNLNNDNVNNGNRGVNYDRNTNRQVGFNTNTNRDVNYNRNTNKHNDRHDDVNVNNNGRNVGYSKTNNYNVPADVYNININNNRRQTVNYNTNDDYTPDFSTNYGSRASGNNNYDVVQSNYGNVSPNTNHRNYNVRDVAYGGYSSEVDVNNGAGYYGSSYVVTESPKYNDGRNWWQPY